LWLPKNVFNKKQFYILKIYLYFYIMIYWPLINLLIFDIVLVYFQLYLELSSIEIIPVSTHMIPPVNSTNEQTNFLFLQKLIEIINDWLHIVLKTIVGLKNLFKTYIFELNI
jgi:hypothetical protein